MCAGSNPAEGTAWTSGPHWIEVLDAVAAGFHISVIDPRRPRILKTVRGAGYRLDPPGDTGGLAEEPGSSLSSASSVPASPDESATLRQLVTGVLSELTDAVIITDVDFRLRSWNSAAELGLAVIGEGIETTAQHEALQQLGCTLGQGFLYGRPEPASTRGAAQAGVSGDPDQRTLEPASTPAMRSSRSSWREA